MTTPIPTLSTCSNTLHPEDIVLLWLSLGPLHHRGALYTVILALISVETLGVQQTCVGVCVHVHVHVSPGAQRGLDHTLEVEGVHSVLFDIEAQVEGQRVLTLLQRSSLS